MRLNIKLIKISAEMGKPRLTKSDDFFEFFQTGVCVCGTKNNIGESRRPLDTIVNIFSVTMCTLFIEVTPALELLLTGFGRLISLGIITSILRKYVSDSLEWRGSQRRHKETH